MTLRPYIREYLLKALNWLSPEWNTRFLYHRYLGYWSNLSHPTTCNEKISWLKLHYFPHQELVTRCADKYAVRGYVTEHGLGHILNDLYGVYDRVEDIPWEQLPDRFVLKCTYYYGMNIVCNDKSKLDIPAACHTMRGWLHSTSHLTKSELHYADIPRRIIVERFLETPDGQLYDYKVYCSLGKPRLVMICIGRQNHPRPKFLYYDPDGTFRQDLSTEDPEGFYPTIDSTWQQMLEAAAQLSKPFPFVRCDFYIVEGHLYFGELTFTSAAGLDNEMSRFTDQYIGSLIPLPNIGHTDNIHLILHTLHAPVRALDRWVGSHFPRYQANKMYRHYLGCQQRIHWDNPLTLNEKINWLKFNTDTTHWTRLTDKYRVREYVTECGLASILVPLYGHWERFEDICWDLLPDQFVLKANNGSGDCVVCSDKALLDKKSLRRRFGELMSTPYGYNTAEPHYEHIRPCIIAEQLLDVSAQPIATSSLIDYKVWCFQGKPYAIWTCFNRTKKDVEVAMYDTQWNPLTTHCQPTAHYKQATQSIPQPKNLKQMLEAAAILAKDNPQVRIDFYEVGGQLYFGEMTFTSAGGYMNFYTDEAQRLMGSLIHLPQSNRISN